MFRLLPVLLPFSFAASVLCRFNTREVTTENTKRKEPRLCTGARYFRIVRTEPLQRR
jgi:hypothetical protein